MTLWTIQSWGSPGQNTGVGSLSLPQGIFPTQGSNPGLPHCRRILYQLSHQGSPLNIYPASYFGPGPLDILSSSDSIGLTLAVVCSLTCFQTNPLGFLTNVEELMRVSSLHLSKVQSISSPLLFFYLVSRLKVVPSRSSSFLEGISTSLRSRYLLLEFSSLIPCPVLGIVINPSLL